MDIDKSLFTAAAVGGILGLIVSIGYRVKTKKDAAKATKNIVGIPPNSFISYTLLGATAGLIVVFSSLAFMVGDFTFPREHPTLFGLELILIAVIPALLFLVCGWLRGSSMKHAGLEFALLTFKFALGHTLLQLSGYYSYLF